MERDLNFLCSYTLPTAFPPSGLQGLTFSVPGPVDRTYTVVSEPLHREILEDAVEDPVAHEDSIHACPIAIMEVFHDKDMMMKLIARTFLRLRVAYPGLRP